MVARRHAHRVPRRARQRRTARDLRPVAGRRRRQTHQHVKGTIAGVAWRPDGRALAYLMRDPAPGAKAAPAAPAPSSSPATQTPAPSSSPPRKHRRHHRNHHPRRHRRRKATPKRSPSPTSTISRARPRGPRICGRSTPTARTRTRSRTAPRASPAASTGCTTRRPIAVTEQPDAIFAHFTKAHTVVVDLATGTARPLRATRSTAARYCRRTERAPRSRCRATARSTSTATWSCAASPTARTSRAASRSTATRTGTTGSTTAPILVGAPDGVRTYVWRLPLDGSAAARIDLGEVDFGNDATVARDGTLAFVGRLPEPPRRDLRAAAQRQTASRSATRTPGRTATRWAARSASTGRRTA